MSTKLDQFMSNFESDDSKRGRGTPIKDYKCRNCQESNSEFFTHGRKTICKKCFNESNKIKMKNFRLKIKSEKLDDENEDDESNEAYAINYFCDLTDKYIKEGKIPNEYISGINKLVPIIEEVLIKTTKKMEHKLSKLN